MKQTFVMLSLMSSLYPEDPVWAAAVAEELADGPQGYCVDQSDAQGPVHQDYSCSELEFVDKSAATVYNFSSSPGGGVSFYHQPVQVFRVLATGELCVMDSDDLFDL